MFGLMIVAVMAVILGSMAERGAMRRQMRTVERWSTPRPYPVHEVRDMRTGETVRTRACVEGRNVRTGRVAYLRPVEVA